jgi:hypothetical protein
MLKRARCSIKKDYLHHLFEQIIGRNNYGSAILLYLDGKGISWVCWIYDPLWKPTLIESWDTFKPMESGEFFRKTLRREIEK